MSSRIIALLPRSLGARLAAVALVLGVGALFGAPRDSGTVTINSRELAAIVESEVDHVTAPELADWIVQSRTDMRILDLRAANEYAEYHIPGAENVLLTNLVDYPLYRNEKIVLYSGGGIHSAQAWFLLQAHGFRGSYILLGGLDAWKDEILFPTVPANPTPAQLAEFQRASAVSAFFGGAPQAAAGSQAAVTPIQMPTVEMPTVQPVAAPGPRKKKEGC
jgi:rhodanese-related sulfurtransferase